MDPVSHRTRASAAAFLSGGSTRGQAVPPVTQTGTSPDAGGRSGPPLPAEVVELLEAARRNLAGSGSALARLANGAGAPWGSALAEALLQGGAGLPADLAEVLQGLALQPGADGEALRGLLATAGSLPVELLGGTATSNPAAALLEVALAQLLPAAEAEQPLTAFERQELARVLDGSLRQAVWLLRDVAGGELSPRALAALSGAFQGELAGVLARTEGAEPWRAALSALAPGALLAGREGALVRALYAEAGPELRSSLQGLAQNALAAELDARLSAAAEGSDSERMRQVQAALEQERLGSELRQRQDGGFSWSLPLADAEGWTALALWIGQRRAASGGQEGGERSYRVQLDTELSGLGPVRASLLMGSARIAVRLEVENAATAQMLRKAAGDLEALLGAEGQRVVLAVVERPKAGTLQARGTRRVGPVLDGPQGSAPLLGVPPYGTNQPAGSSLDVRG